MINPKSAGSLRPFNSNKKLYVMTRLNMRPPSLSPVNISCAQQIIIGRSRGGVWGGRGGGAEPTHFQVGTTLPHHLY